MVKLIAFDLEGTLVKSISSWVELHKRFGTWEKGKEYAELFFAGKIDYVKWAELDASLWRGHTGEEIMEWANSVEYMEGAKELIGFLRENDFRIAILSSGLICLAGRIAKELGVDYVFANELIFDENGVVTGEVNPTVDFKSKGTILRELKAELEPEVTIAVGDGYNDLSMFKEADVSIAINPHEGVEGDHNVESLHEVMEIIAGLERGQ
ncbi:HAD-IB family phosphatase [Thermococcus aciditolerans]|uniref:phosphoserine phosphatase n=1 Tax=Thermococcus aciditolerans TaxID=2598455 RepID=A0A5C0SMK1_9EURY|nr:HAD-IB family phosphatase [Thermococcus aciditolerans]QEK15623.1 HAD-IB family phosphatase [Thermococcus aciditolerans]